MLFSSGLTLYFPVVGVGRVGVGVVVGGGAGEVVVAVVVGVVGKSAAQVVTVNGVKKKKSNVNRAEILQAR